MSISSGLQPVDFKSFDDIVAYVRQLATDADKKRIEDEITLFKQRGWEEYVMFIVNLLQKIEPEKRFHMDLSLSAMDSYVICRASGLEDYHPPFRRGSNFGMTERLLLNSESWEVLSNDALRLNIDIIGIMHAYKKHIEEIGLAIEEELKKSQLNYKETLIPQSRKNDGCERIIISKEAISREEELIVENESKDSSEEEKNVLRNVLIVNFGYKNRL